jgi:transposase InsO family protein
MFVLREIAAFPPFPPRPSWRARKIQAELMKFGIRVSLATVSRYVPKTKPDPAQQQRWMTFLRNHKDVISGMLLWRADPSLPDLRQRRDLLPAVASAIKSFEVDPKRTAFRSPWQNGIAERVVGSVRRELLDRVVFLSEGHSRRLLRDYVDYYNNERVHTAIQDSPAGRPVESRPSSGAKVIGFPRVGGLHHRYRWREAS